MQFVSISIRNITSFECFHVPRRTWMARFRYFAKGRWMIRLILEGETLSTALFGKHSVYHCTWKRTRHTFARRSYQIGPLTSLSHGSRLLLVISAPPVPSPFAFLRGSSLLAIKRLTVDYYSSIDIFLSEFLEKDIQTGAYFFNIFAGDYSSLRIKGINNFSMRSFVKGDQPFKGLRMERKCF